MEAHFYSLVVQTKTEIARPEENVFSMYLTYKKRHYSYECKATAQERPYVSRPSRSQQFRNPKLVPKLTNETLNPLEKKKGVADEELAKVEAERERKREREEDDELIESNTKRHRSRTHEAVGEMTAAAAAIARIAAEALAREPGTRVLSLTVVALLKTLATCINLEILHLPLRARQGGSQKDTHQGRRVQVAAIANGWGGKSQEGGATRNQIDPVLDIIMRDCHPVDDLMRGNMATEALILAIKNESGA
ncbi:hypothetical protein FBEOM_11828 [Fusarium beomiforme]|uniref:Uncharacterized protein n=1 Tax=Fusarium beomiforme TaxID=44412 RepID=A0A9P5DTM0_9HYPO|nr:hypothetical protein FBEOM_11828 [Fusarium beomiforme]